MGGSRVHLEADRRSRRLRARMAEELRRLREDAGVSQRALAEAAGVPQPFVSRIEAGSARPSLETYVRLATALGADLAFRPYPEGGPRIRDRHQARMIEALLAILHPRWRAYPEVPVRTPARGSIDVVLHDTRDGIWVPTELESGLRRIEQQVRRAAEKAASLASWPRGPGPAATASSQLIVVRSTRDTRRTAAEFPALLESAFPYPAAAALAALAGTAPWPGPALVWARLEDDRVRFGGS